MWMHDLCSEDGQRALVVIDYDVKDCCVVSRWRKDRFLWYNFLFKQINHIRTAVHGHPQLSRKCGLPSQIRFNVFDRCFREVEPRACETLRSCAKRFWGLAVTALPGMGAKTKKRLFSQSCVQDYKRAETRSGTLCWRTTLGSGNNEKRSLNARNGGTICQIQLDFKTTLEQNKFLSLQGAHIKFDDRFINACASGRLRRIRII